MDANTAFSETRGGRRLCGQNLREKGFQNFHQFLRIFCSNLCSGNFVSSTNYPWVSKETTAAATVPLDILVEHVYRPSVFR